MDKSYEFLSRTGDGVCVVDGEQRIVLWNDAASALLGFGSDEVLGRPCYQVLGGSDESGCAVCRRDCAISHAARRGERVRASNVNVRTRDAGRIRLSVSTIALPASWHELSVLAHLFRSADVQTHSSDERLPDDIVTTTKREAVAGSTPSHPTDELTAREHEVLRQLSTGASTEVICARLQITTSTTRAHVRRILSKLGVHDRLEAVTFGLRTGMLKIARDGDPAPDAQEA